MPENGLMKRTMRLMFFAVEGNLLLWLAMLGMLLEAADQDQSVKTMVVVGTAFAAIVQHWAYYAVYKKAKQM